MPLLDHFHPPLLGHRHWEGFHGWWAAAIAGGLNESLPEQYFAEFQVTLGTRIEVDVAALAENGQPGAARANDGQTAVLARTWSSPTTSRCRSLAAKRGLSSSPPSNSSVLATRIAPKPAEPSRSSAPRISSAASA